MPLASRYSKSGHPSNVDRVSPVFCLKQYITPVFRVKGGVLVVRLFSSRDQIKYNRRRVYGPKLYRIPTVECFEYRRPGTVELKEEYSNACRVRSRYARGRFAAASNILGSKGRNFQTRFVCTTLKNNLANTTKTRSFFLVFSL